MVVSWPTCSDEAVCISAPSYHIRQRDCRTSFANLTISRSIPRVSVFGDLVGAATPVAQMREHPHTVQLELIGADLVLYAGRPGSAAYEALSRAFVGPMDVGMVAGSSGWQLAASGLLLPKRESASLLTITVPPLPAYRIVAPETVAIAVPAEAILQHDSMLPSSASFIVTAAPGIAKLSGTLLHKNATTRTAPPQVGGKSLDIQLLGDSWTPSIGTDDALRRKVVEGMRSAQSESLGWNALIEKELMRGGAVSVVPPGGGNVTVEYVGIGNLSLYLLDDYTLRLDLPVNAPYSISTPETISVTVPSAAPRLCLRGHQGVASAAN